VEMINALEPGGSHQWTCQIEAKPAGTFAIEITWMANRVDLSRTDGKLSLAVQVQTLRESVKVPRLAKSPYIVGSPLDAKSKMFFGREDVITQVNRALRTEGPSTVILLEGNRRVGKSSLLKRLVTTGLPSEWVP